MAEAISTEPVVGTSARSVQGKVLRVNRERLGKDVVLQGVIQLDRPGQALNLYMRGREVVGSLEEGDCVRLDGQMSISRGRRIDAKQVENLTTGAMVTVERPPRYQRIAQVAGPAVWSAFIGPVAGGLVVAALGIRGSNASRNGAHAPVSGPSVTVLILVFVAVSLTVGMAVFFGLYRRQRRKRSAASSVPA